MELATLEYNLMKGRARLKAIAEEKRKRQEYEIQQRHLFPPPDAETRFATTFEETPSQEVEGKKPEDPDSSRKGKSREPADPDIISPVPRLPTPGTLDVIQQVTSSSSTEVQASTIGIPSPPSSTSTPPSPTVKSNSKIWRTKTVEKYQVIPMTSEKYRVKAIQPWVIVDSFWTTYATPVPDIQHVMELGVLHLASGGAMKGARRYHKDCCPNWPLPTTSGIYLRRKQNPNLASNGHSRR